MLSDNVKSEIAGWDTVLYKIRFLQVGSTFVASIHSMYVRVP